MGQQVKSDHFNEPHIHTLSLYIQRERGGGLFRLSMTFPFKYMTNIMLHGHGVCVCVCVCVEREMQAFTHICVGALVGPWTGERNKLMAPFVDHKTAHCG